MQGKKASRLIIGGSYVTEKENPSDFDCVIVFPRKDFIPEFPDSAIDGDITFDILFASEDFPKVIDGYVGLFSHTRKGEDRGVVEIKFDASEPWKVQYPYSDEELNVVRRAYSNRKIVERKQNRGILVSIHGVNTIAAWNALMSPIVSSQGWIFAPFVYDNPKRLLVCKDKRDKVIQDFRMFIYDIYRTYNLPISVICHSFGSYIITRYLRDGGGQYVEFDSIVMTGGIVDTQFDWRGILTDQVGSLLNVYTTSDRAVWWMPPRFAVGLLSKFAILDRLFGKCGIRRFVCQHEDLSQREINILNHTHVFQRDFIINTMMPFISSNLNHFYVKRQMQKQSLVAVADKTESRASDLSHYPEGTNHVRFQNGKVNVKNLEFLRKME